MLYTLLHTSKRHPDVALSAIVTGSLARLCLTTAFFVAMVMWKATAAAAAAAGEEDEEEAHALPGFLTDISGYDVVVSTDAGAVRGKRRQGDARAGGATTTVDWFLGIPYAKPPVGKLRFKRPESPEPWSPAERHAFRFGPACPQIDGEQHRFFAAKKYQSEDCLSLNVYTPYENESITSYPVMFYLHGGSYKVGSGSVYLGHLLAQHGVVVVTINYRLGILGFLASKDPALKGNYGLLDQIKALEWVMTNIRSFRGNPRRVTLFGNSAGGGSVGLLALSPLTKGMFSQVIVQSGSPLAFWAVHNETSDLTLYVRSLATELSCNRQDMVDIVSCLRDVDWQKFVWLDAANREIDDYLPTISPMGLNCKPAIDGYVIPDSPKRLLLEQGGFSRPKAVMTGIVEDEWSRLYSLFLNDLPDVRAYYDMENHGLERQLFERLLKHVICRRFGYDEAIYDMVLQQYTNWDIPMDALENTLQYLKFGSDLVFLAPTVQLADLYNKVNVPVYLYVFNHHNKSSGGSWNYHQLELAYVFGSPFSDINLYEKTNYSDQDRVVSKMMMELWTNFAKSGNPSRYSRGHSGYQVRWNEYTNSTSFYLEISNGSSKVKRHLRAGKMDFWNRVIPSTLDRLRSIENVTPCRLRSQNGTYILLGVGAFQLILLIALLILALKRPEKYHQSKVERSS